MMFALLLALAAADEPPPAPVEQAPPVVELAPPKPPPPVIAPPEPAAPPGPPATPQPDKKPKPPVEKYGVGPVSTGLIQVAAGTGACCLGCGAAIPVQLGLGLLPVVGSYASDLAGDIIIGTAVGGTEAVLGDVVGGQRAPVAWPTLFAVAMFLGDTATVLVLKAVYKVDLTAVPQDAAGFNAYVNQHANYFLASGAAGIGFTLAAIVGPSIIYGATAVDKKPGDEGQGFPGIFGPADPQPKDTKAITIAMA